MNEGQKRHDSPDAGDGHAPMAVVRTVSGELEAETIRSALESAGIPARIKMESVAKVITLTVDGLGKVEILVPEDRLDEANEILSSAVDLDRLEDEAMSGIDREDS